MKPSFLSSGSVVPVMAVALVAGIKVLRRRAGLGSSGMGSSTGDGSVGGGTARGGVDDLEEEGLVSPFLTPALERETAAVWQYKAEGNMNVVFTYAGSTKRFVGRVLRLCKTTVPPTPIPLSTPSASPTTTTTTTTTTPAAPASSASPAVPPPSEPTWMDPLEYAHGVIRPLVGREYVVPGTRVPVSAAFVAALQDRLDAAVTRPDSRTRPLDPHQPYAVLMLDRTLVPDVPGFIGLSQSFCVELKPKWGLLPQPGAPADDVRSRVCRFCMHQALKLKQGKISSATGYCPIDLFSRHYPSVLRALRALGRCPQNNFRLFRNGAPLFTAETPLVGSGEAGGGGGGEAGASDSPEASLATLALSLRQSPFDAGMAATPDGCGAGARAGSSNSNPQSPTRSTDPFFDAVATVVCKDTVLDVLKAGQGMDTDGVHTIVPLYEAALADARVGARDEDEARQRLCDALAAATPETAPGLARVRQFLTAATLKDSSLLVSFKLVVCSSGTVGALPSHVKFLPLSSFPSGGPAAMAMRKFARVSGVQGASGASSQVGLLHSEAVVDIDPKLPYRIPRYQALDLKVKNTFLATNPSPDRKCGVPPS